MYAVLAKYIFVNENGDWKPYKKIHSSRMTNLRVDKRWGWETKGIVFVSSARAVYQRETRRCWYRSGSENRGTIFIGSSERSLPRLKVDRWKIVKMICWTMGIVRTDRHVWPPTIVAFRLWILESVAPSRNWDSRIVLLENESPEIFLILLIVLSASRLRSLADTFQERNEHRRYSWRNNFRV